MRLPQAAADADGRHSVRAAVQRAVFGAVSDMFFHIKVQRPREPSGVRSVAGPLHGRGSPHDQDTRVRMRTCDRRGPDDSNSR